MGFWKKLIRVVTGRRRRGTTPAAPPPPPSPPPPRPPAPPTGGGGFDPGDFGNGGDEGDGEFLPDPLDLPFDFTIAGYLPLGGDFNSDYVNTTGYPMDPDGVDWPDLDYVVVHVIEPNGSDYYTTLVGPFDDYDDFYSHLASWWEEGSI